MGVKDSVMARFLGNAEKFSDEQVAQTLTLLVTHGVKRHATDIHIEPQDRYILVRYRIDGRLRGIHKLPRAASGKLMRQLKILADLDPEDLRAPQEGHYDVTGSEQPTTVHVYTMPILGGEKAVLHLAVQAGAPQELEALGFWGENLDVIRTALARTHGLIVVAGPRRAGVSTTLHAMLGQLNSPAVSIATVEERAPLALSGASHILANTRTGITIQGGLQAVLRQDPNVIMVSTLPNRPSAELAVQAALAGHLVLTGLHADNAPTALLHLRAMGIESFLLATAARIVIGQRLVRRLCPGCRERHALDDRERTQLEKQFGITNARARERVHSLEQAAAKAGVGEEAALSTTATRITHVWQANEEGCESCEHTGFVDRTAIVEVLQNTETIQKQLVSRQGTSVHALHVAALKEGFIPMPLDGLIKALRGETTTTEVLRSVAPTLVL